MVNDFNGKILGAFDNVHSVFFDNIQSITYIQIIDVVIVGILVYFFFEFLRQTRALGILYGMAVLLVLWLIGQALELTILNTVLKWIFTPLLIAIPVVFQPELRSGLERIGRSTQWVTDFHRLSYSDIDSIIDEILKAVVVLSSNTYGALIVINRTTGLREYIETGQILSANLNSKLLVNIFTPKAPLHDGAVIISGNKIVSAAATLPLSDDVVDLSLGTRHKAALSLSGQTDALCLIVSEETGAVSLAVNGRLQRNLNIDDLKIRLIKLMKMKRNPLRA